MNSPYFRIKHLLYFENIKNGRVASSLTASWESISKKNWISGLVTKILKTPATSAGPADLGWGLRQFFYGEFCRYAGILASRQISNSLLETIFGLSSLTTDHTGRFPSGWSCMCSF
jgi:hypothetical protein